MNISVPYYKYILTYGITIFEGVRIF